MPMKKILEQLKKEKDKIKYLEKELKKTEDKNIKKEIENLIEKLKKEGKENGNGENEKIKAPSLEQIAMSIPRMRTAPTEALELQNYQPRSRMRVATPMPAETGQAQRGRTQGYNDSYGSNIKSEYIRTKADFNSQLEASGLIAKSGFTTTAESKHAIQQRAGDRKEYIQAGDNLNIQQYNIREEMIKEDVTGLSHDLKQAKRGRKEIGVYHG
ncbi:hypothetical protein HYV89_03395 [Candidatus Woesearchaeota archaeon]|nr:hypothetical protein [Candidatus Woesearchaeota archaeon]